MNIDNQSLKINRRSVLRSAPVALTATAIGAGALASSSRIQELYAEWRKLKIEAGFALCEDEVDQKIESMFALEGQIVAIEAETAEEVAIKLIVVTSDFDFDLSGHHAEDFLTEVEQMAGLKPRI